MVAKEAEEVIVTARTARRLRTTGQHTWQKWYSMKGSDMALVRRQPAEHPQFTIENGNTARVQVSYRPNCGKKPWLVQWYLLHAYRMPHPNDTIQGQFMASTETVQAMFGLRNNCMVNDYEYGSRMGALCAVPYQFIRDGHYLTVSGMEGGVSILLTDEIMDEVERVTHLR
jgi:hypothetical protein